MMKNSKVIMEIVIIISLLFALSTVAFADNTQIIIGGGSTNTQNDTVTNIPNVINTTTNTNTNINTNTSYRTNTNTETLPKTGVTDGYVVAILVTVCAISAIYGRLTVGQLSCFLSYANQYTKPFNEISGVVTEF